ncbi:MAG: CYTH domain-containing protein [Anaerolineae bacterium]|nr:CYTH domain-containing protein [Anaerolineae bacterium]
MRKSDQPRETEIALVIRSPRAEQIADEIARLGKLGRYRLAPAEVHFLRDVYFDTRDGALQAQRLALRLRVVNGKQLITLKGPLSRTEQGVVKRLEIELAWSRAAFTRITRELHARGIGLTRADAAYRREDWVGTFKRAGLRVVQDRVTRRRARNIINTTGRVCAELAIDKTTFFFGKQVVHLHEIEIKAKSPRARVGKLAQHMETMFAPILQRWQSKIVTGKAIEKLLERGVLQNLLDAKNGLTPAALDRVGREITRMLNTRPKKIAR